MSHADFLKCKSESYPIFLTPTKPVPPEWIGSLEGKHILALASGGGQQCPYFAAKGAIVTVFDLSEKQLQSERVVAEREMYNINIIQGDMSKPLPFDDDCFDMIFNPVSSSYIESVESLWSECYRILKPKGKLLAGFANPTIYLFDLFSDDLKLKYEMPFCPFKSLTEEEREELFATDGVQFGHSFSSQIGGVIKSGFTLKGFYEDYHPLDNTKTRYDTRIGAVASLLSHYMPVYFTILAEKT